MTDFNFHPDEFDDIEDLNAGLSKFQSGASDGPEGFNQNTERNDATNLAAAMVIAAVSCGVIDMLGKRFDLGMAPTKPEEVTAIGLSVKAVVDQLGDIPLTPMQEALLGVAGTAGMIYGGKYMAREKPMKNVTPKKSDGEKPETLKPEPNAEPKE